MQADILIFAVVAAFLVYRLGSVLGTRHGGERQRPNPFAVPGARGAAAQPVPGPVTLDGVAVTPRRDVDLSQYIDPKADTDGRVTTGLGDIMAADPGFDVAAFMPGARAAFGMIVEAYNKGDAATLKTLLSPRLYAEFSKGMADRAEKNLTAETVIHRIKSAKIVEAHLGGLMAYVTVDYDVEETAVVRDASGAVVEGSPDHVIEIEDVWTFTRDTRARDPNWTLIETRAAEKAAS